MDETTVSELEAAIADAGALLVRAQKYRHAAAGEGADLERLLMDLGHRARRLHRQDALDAAAAERLLAEARTLAARLRARLAAVRADPRRAAAVAALAAGDRATLARLLPDVFTDLEAVPPPPLLFQAVPWLRRGRPQPAADVTAAIVAVRDAGLVGEGDDLSPGADADLPAVVFVATPPADEPVALCFSTGGMPGPVLQLTATGEYLVHRAGLRAPFTVHVAEAPPGDEQLRLELSPADYTRWRSALLAALGAAGIPVDDA